MLDSSKLKKAVHKKGFVTEMADPTAWISSGNYAFNFLMTGDFNRAIPNHRSFTLAGPQGSGKSLMLGTFIKHAQIQDPDRFVIYVDTEESINEEYLSRIGVDMSEDRFMAIKADTIEETTELFTEILNNTDENDKLFLAIDSVSNLETEKELEGFQKGELTNDFGLFAKKLKQLVKNINKKVAKRDMIFGYTCHAYENNDPTNGKGKWIVSGGSAQLHIPSQTIMFDKLKLKEGSDVVGVRMKVHTEKNRFNQPFLNMTLSIPYNTGIDPYDGLAEFLESEKLITKNGAWFSFDDVNGQTHKFQKKNINEYFDKIIEKWDQIKGDVSSEEPSDELTGEPQLLEESNT